MLGLGVWEMGEASMGQKVQSKISYKINKPWGYNVYYDDGSWNFVLHV